VGAAIRDGYIKSIDDPVTQYIPELGGSGYDGVTIRHILTMTSGVRWNENYTNPNSDVARMFANSTPPGMDVTVAYLRTLPREAEPGTKWVYKTGETNLIGVLVRKATRKTLAGYLSEKLWRPYGMEADAFWQVDEGGQEIGGCCISVTLRDYARIGQFTLEGGRAGGRDVVPSGWIADATRAQAPIGAPGRGYGYQWWSGPEGTYMAQGIFGQLIYMDPARRLVIVTSSAWPKATGSDMSAARAELIRQITAAVG
jgi:CubicO group peptidase (beta-lactamase class C family)